LFADPQTITIAGSAKSLVRISDDGLKSIYQTADEEYRFTISHRKSGNRTQRMIRLDRRIVAADPLTAANQYASAGVYIVIDQPAFGFTSTQLKDACAGLMAWFDATAQGKLLASEH